MHLIDALASGVRGCENGSVRLFRRGTATRASWYNTFEASTAADSSGADIPLDSNGGVVAYVNEFVEVDCYSSTGVLVRSFVAGSGAPGVEAISPAFTGVDYVTGVSAVSKPLALSTILDRWLESAGTGAIDWKVLLNGAATTLQVAIGALNGLVFNVKSPAYGATGDGVTDDTNAIQAALSAAIAAGGGTVFFPKGTYRITSAIAWSHLVNILGVGIGLSVISSDSPSNASILTWTTGTAQASPVVISGVDFSHAQSNTGVALYNATVAANVLLHRCRVSVSTNGTGQPIDWFGPNSRLKLIDSIVYVNGAGFGLRTSATSRVHGERSRFIATGASYNSSLVRYEGDVLFTGCEFDVTAVTAVPTSLYGLESAAVADAAIFGCAFLSSAKAFTTCSRNSAGARVTTKGNDFGASTAYNASTGAPDEAFAELELKNSFRLASASAAPTVPDGVRVWNFKSTGTVPTVTMPGILYPGQPLTLIIYNTSGGAWVSNVIFSGATLYGATGTNAADGQVVVAEFVASDIDVDGTETWLGVSVKLGSA